jgi:hypothetical protein
MSQLYKKKYCDKRSLFTNYVLLIRKININNVSLFKINDLKLSLTQLHFPASMFILSGTYYVIKSHQIYFYYLAV